MELFDDYVEWTRAAVVEGGCCVMKRKEHFWAQGWEGQNCGEWYPDKNQGYLDFS